jgi:lysyl oxidase
VCLVPQQPVNCDVVHLDVETDPSSYGAGDGVLVTIRWATDYDQYNLFVSDPSGVPLAQGTDVDSNGQAVLIKQPQKGVYTISVVPFYTTFPQDLTYDGSAVVWHDPNAGLATGTKLLPQLWTVAPTNFHLSDIPPIVSNPTGWRWTPPGTFPNNSCYADEITPNPASPPRCLRFDNDIRNLGPGTLKLRFNWTTNWLQDCQMEQEIDVVGGTPIDRNAGPCEFHAEHAHFHYMNMANYGLYAVRADGMPAATATATGIKLGYCAIDVDNWSFGLSAAKQHARVYSFPTCNVPNTPPSGSDTNVWEYMGISPGWGDIYTWDLPGQYIDVTNVPDGTYELVSRANPDGGLVEGATGLETGVTCIRISGTTVTEVKEFPSQSNTAPLPRCGGTVKTETFSSVEELNAPTSAQNASPASVTALPNTATPAPAPVGGALLAVAGGVAVAVTRRRRRDAGPRKL